MYRSVRFGTRSAVRRLFAFALMVSLAGALTLAAAPALADEAPAPAPAQSTAPVLLSLLDAGPITSGGYVARQCCKICRKGKACGNSCINRAYTCHRPPGCACNGN